MADRYLGINLGADGGTIAVGSSTTSKDIEIVYDAAVVDIQSPTGRQQIALALELLEDYIRLGHGL